MWEWSTVTISEQKIRKWKHDENEGSTEYLAFVPAISFNDGPLCNFLEGYSKLQKLRKDNIIDEQMFTDWVLLKIRDLDNIGIETQNKAEDEEEQ